MTVRRWGHPLTCTFIICVLFMCVYFNKKHKLKWGRELCKLCDAAVRGGHPCGHVGTAIRGHLASTGMSRSPQNPEASLPVPSGPHHHRSTSQSPFLSLQIFSACQQFCSPSHLRPLEEKSQPSVRKCRGPSGAKRPQAALGRPVARAVPHVAADRGLPLKWFLPERKWGLAPPPLEDEAEQKPDGTRTPSSRSQPWGQGLPLASNAG